VSIRFWRLWLVVATSVVALFGFALVLSASFARWLFGWILFGSATGIDGLGAEAQPYLALVHGVLGAVMTGWALALLLVVLGPFARGEWEAWRTIAASLVAWFVLDTALSLVTGFWPNVVLNLALALLFAVPLAATYKTFQRPHT
jgi:hypothetical protein